MKHGVLKGFHPMIGIDYHQVLVPPAPLTPAPVPHNTVHILIGLWVTAVYSEKIFTDSFGPTIMKGPTPTAASARVSLTVTANDV